MRRRAFAIAAVIVLTSPEANGDVYVPRLGEILHLQSSTTGRTDGGTDLRLPPGYFLDEPTFQAKDVEMRRLQEAETRLKAENDSFRKTQKEWQPGWKLMMSALVIGIAGGVYVRSKFD